MPSKRARRHLSQLSEFERCLIIGMKTAGWSTRSVAGEVDRSDDSFNDTSRRRRSNCSTNNFQTACKKNLKSKRPFHALPLTPEHRQVRLQWCQARSMWNGTDWQKVVFSDES
ncbi:uncharacterized protein TNCV_1990581 [Trichonephila clavipes]|nr:uncharacterized protein TNCV_1990581 [Trichonephila clavipes]